MKQSLIEYDIEQNIQEFAKEHNIRKCIVVFAENFTRFVNTYGRTPKSGEESEKSLYHLWRIYTEPENSSEVELKFLDSCGIEIKSNRIRSHLRNFVTQFEKYMQNEGIIPVPSRNKIYPAWIFWTNPNNLTEREKEYLAEHNIPLRTISVKQVKSSGSNQEIRKTYKKNLIRKCVIVFAKNFTRFVKTHNRPPKSGIPEEKSLYNLWLSYTNPEDSNEIELKFLKSCGIDIRDNTMRPRLVNFVNQFNEYIQNGGTLPIHVKSNIYSAWSVWANPNNLTDIEKEYLIENNIPLKVVTADGVRYNIKNFASKFSEFVEKEKRIPMQKKSAYEKRLYNLWRKMINNPTLTDTEIKYLEDFGIHVSTPKHELNNTSFDN